MSIEIRRLTKRFNGFTAVNDVSIQVETGSLVAILGPSGSGKSTLLRIVAGLEIPDGGDVLLTGKEATGLSARERNVGFVFQHYALFGHMRVWDNVAFGLKVRKARRTEIEQRVTELLELVQLKGLERRFPSQLSGGQRQRVAVARALAPSPAVLLLDEPFGALDAKVREELREWIRRLHEKTRTTTLFVTHDQHEALEVADRIIVMNHGRIEQDGTPREIFDHPATNFVAEFVGESNFMEADVVEPGLAHWGGFEFSANGFPPGGKVRVFFRPHDVYVTSRQETMQVPAQIESARFRGPVIELVLDVGDGKRVIAHVPEGISVASGFETGREVYVGITGFKILPSWDERTVPPTELKCFRLRA
ncbi:MAG: ABC transporter ATP-binding protein [Nitrospirae bacterium]|nr:ABC transporter ATP-binding protein [Nitrospirota bacterium]